MTIHSMWDTPTYNCWKVLIQRCTNQNRDDYPWYGGRGIKVCARWCEFKNFLADVGERPGNSVLRRIDTDGHYEPGNTCWATYVPRKRGRRAA
jgi:hypothetical protein